MKFRHFFFHIVSVVVILAGAGFLLFSYWRNFTVSKVTHTSTNSDVLAVSDESFENEKNPAFRGDAGLADVRVPADIQSFYYDADVEGVLEETGSMGESGSQYWWLNSGARLITENGVSRTLLGRLDAASPWQKRYFEYNPSSTDGGYYPQNIFRLITRSRWDEFQQEVYVRVLKDNFSLSQKRNASNGIFLLNRYQDSNNLYYTGIRVDGHAVIKRKRGGVYTTLAYEPVLEGEYDRMRNPSLLPKNTWIGVRSVGYTEPDGGVRVRLYLDIGKKGAWTLAADVLDTAGSKITNGGFAGIRTDFMDIEFDDYRITAL